MNTLTNAERRRIIEYKQENEGLKQSQLADWATTAFGKRVTQSTISKTLKRRRELLAAQRTSNDDSLQRRRKVKFPLLEQRLGQWFDIYQHNKGMTSDAICAMAKRIGKVYYGDDFNLSLSNGWLNKFKARHGIVHISRNGEHRMTNNVHAIPVNMSGDEEGVDQFLHKFDMLSNDRAMILLESFRCIEEDDIDEMETEEPLFPPGMSSESEQDEETGELVIEAAEVAKEAEEQPEPEEPAPCTQAQVRQALEVLTDYAFQSGVNPRKMISHVTEYRELFHRSVLTLELQALSAQQREED